MDYIVIDGKKIELSKETVNNIKSQINNKKATPSSAIANDYKYMNEIDWDIREKILVNDKQNKIIYINTYFDKNSKFGNNCVFIKCKFRPGCGFGSDCEFGSGCGFGLGCKFGSGCEFGLGCKFGSNCEFGLGYKFGSNCKFRSGCGFGSDCKFGSGCGFGSNCEFGLDCIKH